MIRLQPVHEATILGLMSGTSCDGLDLALLHFGPGDGEWRLIRGDEHRFPTPLRDRLLAASDGRTPELGVLSFDLMHWCADQVLQFLDGQSCEELLGSPPLGAQRHIVCTVLSRTASESTLPSSFASQSHRHFI